MFFRRNVIDESSNILAEKIKNDLTESLYKSGFSISKIQVDMKNGKMRVSMYISE